MSDLIGTVVGERYELKAEIGRGGQGVVFRARDRLEKRDVAVKVLATDDASLVERMQREQRALEALQGTSAVEVLDFCVAPSGAPCLVMELLDGSDLETELSKKESAGERPETEWLLNVLDPIAETLHAAHRAGIVHRDLKPANIFLLEDGQVKLLDFGLVRMRSAEPLTMMGTVIGSPSYIAPEVWQGQSDLIDHRADVYSLGVIVYRALTGQLPFGGESMQDKLKLATTAERPSLHKRRPDLPKTLDAWTRRALAANPNKRFSTVRVMWDALHLSIENAPPPFLPAFVVRGWRAIRDALLDVVDHLRRRLTQLSGRTSPALPEKIKDVDDQAPTLLWIREPEREPSDRGSKPGDDSKAP